MFSSVVVVLCHFACRRAVLHINRVSARCQVILEQQSSFASKEDKASLPTRIKHGKKLPGFKAIDLLRQHHFDHQSLIGNSTIIVFCTKEEFVHWPVDFLMSFLQSSWYKIDGNIYIILLDEINKIKGKIPRPEILTTDVGQVVVIGVAGDHQLVRKTMGFSTTPSFVELDDLGVVRKIGFLNDMQWQKRSIRG